MTMYEYFEMYSPTAFLGTVCLAVLPLKHATIFIVAYIVLSHCVLEIVRRVYATTQTVGENTVESSFTENRVTETHSSIAKSDFCNSPYFESESTRYSEPASEYKHHDLELESESELDPEAHISDYEPSESDSYSDSDSDPATSDLESDVESMSDPATSDIDSECDTKSQNSRRSACASLSQLHDNVVVLAVRKYMKNDKKHRNRDLPAVVTKQYKKWYRNDKLHRDHDLPAIVRTDGTKEWYRNGRRHRDNYLPAVIRADGVRMWYTRGKLIRVSYPKK